MFFRQKEHFLPNGLFDVGYESASSKESKYTIYSCLISLILHLPSIELDKCTFFEFVFNKNFFNVTPSSEV
jgi:hypothetical protein